MPRTIETLEQAVAVCERIMTHAWMVRTFIKHAPETEDNPELMGIVRAIFDVARALETRIDDPLGYLRMLQKKIGLLREASLEFSRISPEISSHMNFKQASLSIQYLVEDLSEILILAPIPEVKAPPVFRLPNHPESTT